MAVTGRELVYQSLGFEEPGRIPRHLWALPWARLHHGEALERIQRTFPDDITHAPAFLAASPETQGDPYAIGTYTDEWGSVFENRQAGIIGEVKTPLIADWKKDAARPRFPREWLTTDQDAVNRFCAQEDRFVLAGCCPRPFERLQFLRGTADLYTDLLIEPPELLALIRKLHEFYCALLECWAATEVDALMVMDDWGSQQGLLIDPALWRRYFKPLYRDYIAIAHGAGKKIFLHSDGHILAILPDLIELGLDAINSQLFCMGLDALEGYAGRITFWGEIDRQHLLPEASEAEIDQAVRAVHQKLWRGGGCIAQCEFGAGARPENVYQVFSTWEKLGSS